MKWPIGTIALVLVAFAAAIGSESPMGLEYNVIEVKRHLLLETGDGDELVPAGAILHSGDELRTGSRSMAELASPEFAARFVIGEKTRFKLAREKPGVLLEVDRGSLRAVFDKLSGGGERDRLVTTPSAVLAVRGTEYGVEVEKDGDTSIAVFEGTVEVWNIGGVGERVRVRAGESTRVRRGRGPTRPKPHGLSATDWDRGRRRLGQTMGNAEQPQGMGRGNQPGSGGNRSSSSHGGSKRPGG